MSGNESLPDPPSRAASPAWKVLLAAVSLFLSLMLWLNGLENSLDRPSVLNSLSLRQLELSVLAAEGMPTALRSALVGDDPRGTLADELKRQIEAGPLPATAMQRLELALLDRAGAARGSGDRALRELIPSIDVPRRPLLQALLDGGPLGSSEREELLAPWRAPTLVEQLVCEQIGRRPAACPADSQRTRLVLQLLVVNLLPVLLVLLGALLLLGQLVRLTRGREPPAARLEGPPLTLVDVVLLIAGGFVLLGEVLVPLLLQPTVRILTERLSLAPGSGQGLEVLVLYLGLMAAPLTILALMLPAGSQAPAGGWLQWNWRPPLPALLQAGATLLMVLPVVAVSSWLIERIWGDPGGSNPLLDLVLTSGDPLALACFAGTAILLAPLFEETLFRGVLLPVLGRRTGGGPAVLISAAVFAVAHLSLGELVPLFLLGVGLGWLRWRSGRLASPVLMHALWNGLTFLNLLVLAD